MTRIRLAALVVAVVALALLVGVGHAQLRSLVGPERQAIIYDGDLELDSGGIKVLPWGSGKAEPVYDETYIGPQVLKVTSQGPYQGIVLQLGRPADLNEFLASGYGYLDLRVLPAQARIETRRVEGEQLRQQMRTGAMGRGGAAGGRGGGGMRGGGGGGGRGGGGMRGGGGGGGRGGGGMRGGGGGGRGGGGMRGGGGGGGRGGGGMRGGGIRGGAAGTRGGTARAGQPGMPALRPGETESKALTARNLRLVLFTDKGMLVADAVPIGFEPRDERGWAPVTVPLAGFKGPKDATQVRAVAVFADESEVFYLGRIRLIEDKRPVEPTITAEPLFANLNQLVAFSVSLRGGPVDPIISWDFDKSNGIQKQAFGHEVKWLYKNPGDYMVTCTITDKAKVRAPATATVGIRAE